MHKIQYLIAIVGLAIALWLALLPPESISAEVAPAIALTVAMITLLATGVVPEHFTALAFFLFAMLFAVAPASVVFSGFHSTAFWLVFGGLVIGVGVHRTGLGERLANFIAKGFGGTYARIIFGVVVIGVVLAFLMPSTLGRLMILLPIILAMSEKFGFAVGSNGRAGMVIALAMGTQVPGFAILPATVPAMVLSGASESLYGIAPVYGVWLSLHFPVLGLLKALVIALVIILLLPDEPKPVTARSAAGARMSRDERIMSIYLVLALVLWMTDFLHHLSPAWIALAVAVACLAPKIAVVPPDAFARNVSYPALIYLAGVLGLGAMISHSGTGDLLANSALAMVELAPGETFKNFMTVVGMSTLSGLITTHPALPAVMTPIAGKIAAAAGMPIENALMMIVVGFSTVILPYQTPPLIVALQLGNVQIGKAFKACLGVAVISIAILLPLDYLWWHLVGRFN
jgi:anion transporter